MEFQLVFLLCLAFVWLVFAVVQDLRKREIANWINFSLAIFAIGFRFFWSLFGNEGFGFFYQGLIGLAIFFLLGNLLYYSRMFAGGDAKLLFALGAILPFSDGFMVNLNIYFLFLILLFICGAIYGFFASSVLIVKNFKNFKKEFSKQFKANKNIAIMVLFFGLFFIVLGILNTFIIYFGIFILVFPYFYLAARAIDESCMVKKVSPKNLAEGDWLYKDIKVGKRIIKKTWDGLTKKDIRLLQRKKFVLIRQGIPFSPSFLAAFIVLVYLWFNNVELFSLF